MKIRRCETRVPSNCAWTVWDSCEPSTTESIGCSAVKTVSKLDTSTGLRTLGLNGGWIFFCASRCQSIFSKNGWRLISSAPFTPKRCAGSRVRRPVRIDRALAATSSGKTSGSRRIFSYILSVISRSRWRYSLCSIEDNGTHHRRTGEARQASRTEARPESTSRLSGL